MAYPSFKPQRTGGKKKHEDGGVTTAGHTVSGVLVQLGKFLFLVMIMPPMVNYGGLQQERTYLSQRAVLYDIGFGQKLQLTCSGQGQPTVLLDAPVGETSDVWLAVQQELSKLTKTCVYDRAGLGLSDPAPRLNLSDPGEGAVARTMGPASTLVRMVTDLHRLVTFASPQERPLLIVGSGLGGLVARGFAHLHPQDVSGLVLVEPLSESLFDEAVAGSPQGNSWSEHWFGHLVPSLRLLQLGAMTGVNRIGILTGLLAPSLISDNEEEVMARQKHQLCDPFHLQAVIDEHRALNTSLQQMADIRDAWPLPARLPCTVMTGSLYAEELTPALNVGWSRAVQDLISRIPGSRHVVIDGASHNMIHQRPGDVAAPIVQMIKSWRSQL